jgi:chaperonin GroES
MAIDKAMTPMDYGSNDNGEDQPIQVEVGDQTEVQEPEEQAPPVHTANLAEFYEDNDLNKVGTYLLDCFEADEQTRQEWLQTYVDGLDYLGFKLEEPNDPFPGASGVYHPILAEAVVRFQSNAIMEIFPAAGPVLTKIVALASDDVVKQAQRVKDELNYQLTDNMEEFRLETEKMLFRLPLAGSVFKKTYYDPLRGRPCSMMIPAEDFVIDYESSDICSSERHCHVMRRSKNYVKKMMRKGFYRSVELPDPVPYLSMGKEKEDELGGRAASYHKDSRHTLLEFHVLYNLPEPFDDPDGVADPYVITVDKSSGKVLSIYRNWAEKDQERNPEQYFTHYGYMPGLGFYHFGLIHLMGSLTKASTSILRQLIDAGTFANLPGGLKTRGLRSKGEDEPIRPGEWRDVDVPAGAIGDNIFPLPYKEPSSTLVALLGNLVDEGRRIGSIAEVEISSQQANAPVGTTLALMERSLKVMSAVHARLHASLKQELRLIANCISEYMPPQYDWDEKGQFNRQEDFDGRVDIVPVSDPNAATQAQRIVQLQAVMQLAQQNPELYNLKELHRVGLQAIGIKDDERILPPDNDPPRLDPVQENMKILTQQPIKVYPDQDHTAHLQVHINTMLDPKISEMVGQSPNAMKIQGQMESHIAEHMAHQYRAEIEQQLGVQLPPLDEPQPPEVEAQISRLVAQAAVQLRNVHQAEMQQKQNEQMAQDPVFQLREREVANKEKETDAKINLQNREMIIDIAKQVSKEMIEMRRIESQEYQKGAEIGANLVTFGATLDDATRKEGVQLGKEIAADIHGHQMTREQMDHEATQKELDRQAEITKARISASKRPSTP